MMKSRAIGAGVAVAAASALAFVLVHVAAEPEISVVATLPRGYSDTVFRAEPSQSALPISIGQYEQVNTQRSRNEKSWSGKLDESSDLFAFVQSAAPAALRGDGAAQFAISEALRLCEGVASLYRAAVAPEDVWSRHPGMTAGLLDSMQKDYALCHRFVSANPFVGLPVEAQSRDAGDWLDLAAADGYPAAEARKAYELMLVAIRAPAAAESQGTDATTREASDLLGRAMKAGGAEAWWFAGLALLAADFDPTAKERGASLVLLACRSGFDCGPLNWRNLLVRCNRLGDPDCPPDATVPYYLEREVGGDVYARAYALAENLTRDIGEHHAPIIDVSISATR